jgi:hypothetical protein
MADNVQIQCINKSDRYNPHERIINVGGINPDGKRWKLSQPEAIQGIENNRWRFYVHAGGKSVWVIVAVSPIREQVPEDGERRRSAEQSPESSRVPLSG